MPANSRALRVKLGMVPILPKGSPTEATLMRETTLNRGSCQFQRRNQLVRDGHLYGFHAVNHVTEPVPARLHRLFVALNVNCA